MPKCRKCRWEIPAGSRFCPRCGAKQDITQNTKTRGNGQGTVFQRPNKTWTAMITLSYEYTEDGKARKLTRSKSGFRTKREALDYLPKLREAPKPKPVTFAQLYEAWLPTHRAGKDTMNCYKAAWKYFSEVADMPILDITIDDLQACMDDCPRGRRTRENMKAMCGLVYKYGIPRRITDMNMGEYLIVSGESGAKDGLPMEALEAIRAHSEKGRPGYVPGADYVLCQCYLGFRPSEFLSLDAIRYNREERAFLGGAKTEAGMDRTVTVSPKIQPIVDRLTRGKVSGPVFCADGGKPMDLKEYRELFYRVLEACGVDNPTEVRDGVTWHKYTPHSCRHTFATLLKRVKGADKDKLELMGHTSTQMLRHYQDVEYSDLRAVTDAI